MSFLDVYVGEISDLSWDPTQEQWSIGNVPHRLSPFFPAGHNAFRVLRQRVEDRTWRGQQVDWGAWAARLTGGQILAFCRECRAADGLADMAHIREQWEDLERFLATLTPDAEYAQVASEL